MFEQDLPESKRRGSRTFEQKLIDDVLLESTKVRPAPVWIRAVVLEEYGLASPKYIYLNDQLKHLERYNDLTTWLLQNLSDLMADTSIVGHLSKKEQVRRLTVLIEMVGVGEVKRLIESIENSRPPENVIVLNQYRKRKEIERILAYQPQEPKGAA